MENTKKIFASGLRLDLPNQTLKEKAPWIKGRISVKVPDFILFLEKYQNNAGFVNLDLKKSDNTGNYYIELNQWKPKEIKVEEDHTAIDPETGIDLNDPNSPF